MLGGAGVRLAAMKKQGPVEAWIVDDTVPKKGTHSVGVARQYCGQLGKQENCRVAVSLSVANDDFQSADRLATVPAGNLGQRCAAAERRRGSQRDPVSNQAGDRGAADPRKPWKKESPPAPMLADAAYGNDSQFREGITELGLNYVLGVQSSTTVWKPGEGPLPKKEVEGHRASSAALTDGIRIIRRSRSSKWRCRLPLRLGKTSCGGKELTGTSVLGLRLSAFVRPIGITGEPTTSGGVAAHRMAQGAKPNQSSTGFPLCRPRRNLPIWSASPSIAGSSSATTKS